MNNRVTDIEERVRVRNALISVADKTRLEELIHGLIEANESIRFYSTGNTHRRIAELLGAEAPQRLTRVSDYTGQPEMQGGLVKTLDFKIYLGLLSESFNEEHTRDLERTRAITFDLVVVNLYPFEQAVSTPQATCEDARAHIDIGGPSMLRAAAKNFLRVAPLCRPEDYAGFIDRLKAQEGATTLEQRFELAQAAFAHTAHYDTAISEYLAGLAPDQVASVYTARER